MECRLTYRRNWATRLMLEKKYNNYAYFITLTYDDKHIHNVNVITKNGEVKEYSTLVKTDMTNFIKQYRKNQNGRDFGKIRYFYCGEYGSDENTHRSHFHRIIYQENPIKDLKPLFINGNHQQIYKSDMIQELWGKGIVTIGEVTLESAGYVARYVTKKQTGEKAKIYTDLNITPEFVEMSRRPGIGSQAFNINKMYDNDYILMNNMNGKRKKLKPPRYYDEMLFDKDPTLYQIIKDKRRENAIIRRNQKDSLTTSDHWEEDQNTIKTERQKILRRNKI